MRRIAIVGPGAVGGTVAAWLAQDTDLSVTLCARTAFDRLRVDTPKGVIETVPAVRTNPEGMGPVDWVLVCTKTYDAAGALPWLMRLAGAQTRVAVLQNGVEHRARFAPHLPGVPILPGVVDIPAERSAPGLVRQRRLGSILVPAGADGSAFVDLFARTPIAVSTADDFATAAWRKLALNSAGVVNALTLKPAGIARDEGVARVMRTIVAECVAVGRAEGAVLPDDLGDVIVNGYRAGPADSVNSLLADRAAGRPMELDARNGVIVRLGAAHGIPTPMNAAVVALLDAAAAPVSQFAAGG
jgi:2-dehydropantoate 2-reductase